MPPVPRPRLTSEASDLLESLERRARFIQEDLIPRLNALTFPSVTKEPSASTPTSSLHVHQRLSDEVREELGVLSRDVDQLEIMVDDQSGASARKELAAIVEGWATRLHELRTASRSAILASKRTLDSQKAASNRSELFGGCAAGSAAAASNEAGDPSSQNLESASQNLTLSLQRLMASMQQELQTSTLSTQLLTSSTSTLAAASNQHDSLTTAMDTAKQLVGALEKADWLDRLLILGAFTFFLVVVVYVVGQRTVGRGLRVMWWLTGGLRSSSSVKENLRKVAMQKSREVAAEKAKLTIAATASAFSATASVLSVATSSITSMASVVAAIKSGPASVDEPMPEPTPTPVPGQEGRKVSVVLESVVPPDPEPTPVVVGSHDEL